MTSPSASRERRRLAAEAKATLRELRIELALLNHRISGLARLRDVDLDCLDVLVRQGSMTPTELARRTGVHPATLTGVLARLETAGWLVRARGEHDRRSVELCPVPERVREIFGHYAGMNAALDQILDDYSAEDLGVIVDFLQKSSAAGRRETEALD
ncbi:MAG TPA: MarR family transcriptional regulator [Nocardioides sp.]|uniref:MarR family transcriptional regulator n=1 Tax=Nocardioides sp. TaxID=35761 RepID=UPI002F3FCE15